MKKKFVCVLVLLLLSSLFLNFFSYAEEGAFNYTSAKVYSTNFQNLFRGSFGSFSDFCRTAVTSPVSWNLTSRIESNTAFLSADYSASPVNNNCPQNLYSYIRKESYTNWNRINISEGLTVDLVLKLEMPAISSLSTAAGLGRTGFVLNIRDLLSPGTNATDYEFYFAICPYQEGIVISSVGGNRDALEYGSCSNRFLSDIDPTEFHNYKFIYRPEDEISVYIDGEKRHAFPLTSIGHRTLKRGHYYQDFVAFSLVNRSSNLKWNPETEYYEAHSKAWVSKIELYDVCRDTFTIYSPRFEDESDRIIYESLDTVKNTLTASGIPNTNIAYLTGVSYDRESFLRQMEASSLFLFAGHGNQTADMSNTFIENNPSGNQGTKQLRSEHVSDSTIDLSDTECIILASCKSGRGDTEESSLMLGFRSKGARTVIGFEETIRIDDSGKFLVRFFEYLKQGNSYSYSAYLATHNPETGAFLSGDYEEESIDSYVIY